MQPMPPKSTPPYHVRVQRITAYSLVANVLFLVAVAASGALAPYVALHAVGGPELASFALPPLPRFAAPLVSGLAADAVAARATERVPVIDRVAEPRADDDRRPSRVAFVEARERDPEAGVAPSPQPTATPPGGGIVPADGGEATVTPVTPPSGDDTDPPSVPVTIERPASSKGNAYGVYKHPKAAKPKPPASAGKKTVPAKKKLAPKKAASAVRAAAAKKAAPRAARAKQTRAAKR